MAQLKNGHRLSSRNGEKHKLPTDLINALAKNNSYRLRIVLHHRETPKEYRRAIYAILLKRKVRS